ncbi:MAG: APC family permease [Thermoplasmatota archaeon]
MARIAVPAEPAPSTAQDPGGDGESDGGLRRELNLFGAVSMIVGIVIGSGIFLGVGRVAAGAGSPSLIVAVWILGGLLTLMGALTYAELGVLFPKAGGEYVFLKEGMGSLAAFMSGWTAFTINLAGSAAALAVIFAEQLNQLKPDGWAPLFGSEAATVKLTAVCLIALLSIVNYFGVKFGGFVQMTFTVLKGALIVLLAGAALLFVGDAASPGAGFFDSPQYVDQDGQAQQGFDPSGFFGLAMVAALFAYDGWTNVVRVGGELRNPGRNIPKAMLLGLVSIMAFYILVSFGYLNVLGFQGFAAGSQAGFDSDRTVASNVANVLFGDGGESLVTVMILVSVFGALNGITLSGPRIYYAMSVDRLFPRLFGQLSPRRTPHYAILFQALLASVFLLFFDFSELTDNVVFISFFFYGLTAAGLLVLRRTHPEMPRPYKVWGYPVVPILFVITSWTFVGYLLYDQISALATDYTGIGDLNRLAGLAVVAAGLPIFFFYRRKLVRQCLEAGLPPPAPLFGPRPKDEDGSERK